MVATTQSPNSSRYLAGADPVYSGVVTVTDGRSLETGTLLYGGRWVLTAAHGVDATAVGNVKVGILVNGNRVRYDVAEVILHPQYNDGSGGQQVTVNDLALVRLAAPAPVSAQRYELYRSSDEVGRDGFFAGFGTPFNGTGNQFSESGPTLRKAQNTIDLLIGESNSAVGITSSVPFGSQFLVDFDNGNTANDASGIFYGRSDVGVGADEGIITAGDSGGPFFLNSSGTGRFEVAGVASYGLRIQDSRNSDIDSQLNSSFGEFAGYERVSFYQQFIDDTILSRLPNVPQSRAEVQTSVVEGNSGTTYAYFYLEFGQLVTDEPVSVAYTTFDITATAGQDYIAVAGRVNIYPGQRATVIPVEIIGDFIAESNETFGLRVSDPVGGDFGGLSVLEATRTIIDDEASAQMMGMASSQQHWTDFA